MGRKRGNVTASGPRVIGHTSDSRHGTGARAAGGRHKWSDGDRPNDNRWRPERERERDGTTASGPAQDGKNARELTAEAAETKLGTLAVAGHGDGTTTSFGRHLVYHTEPFPQDTVLFLITQTHYSHTHGTLCRLRNLHTRTHTHT